jgi:DNA polymerase I-like protein with 3'-5' exonuclease and polymerase domains
MSSYPIGLPIHQIPKGKTYRRFILPPEGHVFIVADCDSQETKIMADFSQDEAFAEIYKKKLNPHAVTAAKISGKSYSEIVEGKDGDFATVYKAGKVTNLGSNYRMGTKTLWKKAHVDWGLTPTIEEVAFWRKVWKQTYNGVQQQWKKFIKKAQLTGYAETLAGRRFYINNWVADGDAR